MAKGGSENKNLSDWISTNSNRSKTVRSNNPSLDTTGPGPSIKTRILALVAFIAITALVLVTLYKNSDESQQSERADSNSVDAQASEIIQAPAQLPQEMVSHCVTTSRIPVMGAGRLDGGFEQVRGVATQQRLSAAQTAAIFGAAFSSREPNAAVFVPRVVEVTQDGDSAEDILRKTSPLPLSNVTADAANTGVKSMYSENGVGASCSFPANEVRHARSAVDVATSLVGMSYLRGAGSNFGPGTQVDGTTGIGQMNLVRYAWWEQARVTIPDGFAISRASETMQPGPDQPGAMAVLDNRVAGISLGNGRMIFASPESGSVIEAPIDPAKTVFYPVPEFGTDIAPQRHVENDTDTGTSGMVEA